MCIIEDDGGKYLNLVNLVVEPDYRRKGVGSLAVRWVCQEAVRRKKKGVRLLAMPIGPAEEQVDKNDLVRFYRRNGFRLLADNESMIWYP